MIHHAQLPPPSLHIYYCARVCAHTHTRSDVYTFSHMYSKNSHINKTHECRHDARVGFTCTPIKHVFRFIIAGGSLAHADNYFFLPRHLITPPLFVCIIPSGFSAILSLDFNEGGKHHGGSIQPFTLCCCCCCKEKQTNKQNFH